MEFLVGWSCLIAVLFTSASTQTCPPNPPHPKSPHLLDCNFDNDDLCYWDHVSGLQKLWDLRSGGTPSFATGPSNDHTTGTLSGKYIYIETSSPSRDGDKAQIISRGTLDPSCSSCKLKFWYHMYGSTIKDLSVFMKPTNGGASKLAWSETGNQGNTWYNATVALASSVPYQVVIEAERGTSFTGDIAIDDITFENCPAPPTPTPPPPCSPNLGPGDCDFEQDSCRCCCWQNTIQGDYNDWRRNRGPTQSHITGPNVDNTYGTAAGHYMFIEVSQSRVGYYSLAKLESRKLKGIDKADTCMLTIAYHMRGRDIGTLEIKKQPDSVWYYWYPTLFSRNGDQGDKWQNITVDLYTSDYASNEFSVSVQASNIGGPFGDMAVDDLTFSPGCTSYFIDRNSCDNAAVCAVVNATNWCSPSYSSGKVVGDCDFECGLCYWNNSVCGDSGWVMNEGGTESYGTGPADDHTYGTTNEGHYFYFEAGNYWTQFDRRKGYNAILESPNIKGSSQPCTMTLYYHMYGRNIGSLLLYLKSSSEFTKIKEVTGEQGNRWIHDNVTFWSPSDYRIHIVATYKDGYQGDIAIDDISFSGAGCVFNRRQDNSYCNNALTSGCADGSRDAFFNNQNIAGCRGEWDGLKSLRDRPTGKCGNNFPDGRSIKCRSPADACDIDKGWRVCGASGNPREIKDYTVGSACSIAAYGRFSAGINHCRRDSCDSFSLQDYGCSHFDVDCNEPLCCGLDCKKDDCQSAFWPNSTYYTSLNQFKGCSRLTSEDAGGVLCCFCPDCPTEPPIDQLCDCSFDHDNCGFTDENGDNYDWTRQSAGTPGFNTGPSNDHTTGSRLGYYMYARSAFGLQEGHVASLRSPEYDISTLECGACRLGFWYHMHGSDIGRLEVFVEEAVSSKPLSRTAVFSKSGEQGDEWMNAVISPLNIKSQTFHILFVVTYGTGSQGDIAIDDVSLSECDYPTTSPPTTLPPACASGQYQCVTDYSCIAWNKLCDGRLDCSDGSDETTDESDPCGEANCDPFYCVNGGRCYIQSGQKNCLCPHPFFGRRCQMTQFTAKPTAKASPTPREGPRTQVCDPDFEHTKCWCLDSEDYRESSFCTRCEPTEKNDTECVCNRAGQCFPTLDFVRGKMVAVFGTASAQLQNSALGGSGSDGSDDSKYIAIGIGIAVIGIILVTVVVLFIMRQKYHTKENVARAREAQQGYGVYDAAEGKVALGVGEGNVADGLSNPLYNDPYEAM